MLLIVFLPRCHLAYNLLALFDSCGGGTGVAGESRREENKNIVFFFGFEND